MELLFGEVAIVSKEDDKRMNIWSGGCQQQLVGTGTWLETISRLAPVKLSGIPYFWLATARFWPNKCLLSRIIWSHFTVKSMWIIILLDTATQATPEFAVTTSWKTKQKLVMNELL